MVASALTKGDIAIVSYETDQTASAASPDALRFVVLKPIGSGTQIFFTDQSWNGSVFAAAGGDGTYTYTAGADIPAGTVITITGAALTAAGVTLSNAGETIYAYQGAVNAPTSFLFAIDIADGNGTFNGSLVNTGLTAGLNAVAVAHDNASFAGQSTQIAATQLLAISDATKWHGSDQDDIGGTTGYSEVTDTTISGPLNNPDMQIFAVMAGGGQSDAILRIDNDEGSNVGTNLARLFRDNPAFSHLSDISFDIEAGYYFVVDSDGNAVNRVLRGNIADLVSGTSSPSLTQIFATDGLNNGGGSFISGEIIPSLEVDTVNNKLYWIDGNFFGDFEGGWEVRRMNYDGTGNTVIAVIDDENDSVNATFGLTGIGDYALDAGRGLLYVVSSLSSIDGLGNTDVRQNHVMSVNVNTGAITVLGVGTDATAGYDPGRLDPAQGQIMAIDVDQVSGEIYFVTQPISSSGHGGIFKYNPFTDTLTELWDQPTPDTYNTLQAFPTGNLTWIEYDEVAGRYYVGASSSIDDEFDGTPAVNESDASIYIGNPAGGAPARVIRISEPTAKGAPLGMEIDYAPVLALSSAGVTYTETAGANSAAGTPIDVASSITISDADQAIIKGATVAITTGFRAGFDVLSFTAGGGVTGSFNSVNGVLSLTGDASFATYQTVLDSVRFTTSGDNPTDYGTNTSRGVSFTVTDGLINSDPITATVNVVGVNDFPINVVPGGTVTVAEDAASVAVTGISVSDADADPASQDVSVTLHVGRGLLTILTNVANGVTAGDVTGNGTGTIVLTATQNQINATLAAVNGLLYTPTGNVNGPDVLTVTTSDGGLNGTGGALTDVDTVNISVTAVNDAPVVIGGATETLAATNEDVANAVLTNTVSTLFGGHYDDSADQVTGGSSANAFVGIAVTANGSDARGQWEYYNGTGWVAIGAATTASAVLLLASAPLRFASAADFNGPAPTLTVHLVDSSGAAFINGATANLTTSGGSTRYSAGTVVLDHSVTAVNDAPVTTGGAAVTLTTIAEDSAPGAGQTVSALFASHFTDVKDTVSGGSSANALAGVAITSNTASAAQGVYEYSDDAGGSWQALPAVSTSTAFVLDTSALIRFVPATDFSGTPPALIAYMIENSAGAVTTGGAADLTTTGGSTPYGTAMTLGITVTPSNDAPIVSGVVTLTAVNEDTAAPAGQLVSALFSGHVSDVDVGDTLAGIAITGNAATTQGTWQYSTGGGIWTAIVTPTEAAALVLAAGTLLRFLPAPNYNGTPPDLTAYLIDSSGGAVTSGAILNVATNGGQTRFSDFSTTISTSITAVNDTPVVPASATAVGATEQTAAVLLGSVTVSDADLGALNGGAGDFGGATFTVQRTSANAVDTFFFASGGLFTVSGGDLQVGGLTFATFTSVGGVLTISFDSSAATATTALVNDLINHITYTNGSDAPPASVTLNYALNDGAPASGQGAGGAASAGGSVLVNITPVDDGHTGAATIIGTAAEDSVLTAVSTLADVDGLGPLNYQWQHGTGASFTDIALATASTYTLGDADIGLTVRVIISYTDGGGASESETSDPTVTIVGSNDAPTGPVTVTGTPTENQVLTANTAALADSDGLGPLHYQWQHNVGSGFVNIVGAADQATYTLGDGDVGGLVRVVVTYDDLQGFPNLVNSIATASIDGVNDPHTGTVTITGTATEDQVLTADTSTLADIDGVGPLSYQWQRDVGSGYVNIAGPLGTASTYTLTDADIGVPGTVRVVVSYTDGQLFAESATSAATAQVASVNDDPTGAVTVTGTVTENQVLTADTSALVDADGLGPRHYQWQHNVGSGFVNIVGAADQATYTLGDGDVGGTVRVVVSYTDLQGTAETVNSIASASIDGVNDPHTGGVSITGTATEDQVLTADTSTLADIDGVGLLSYQWQHHLGSGYVDIAGATASTYTLTDDDVGGLVRVVVSYTDGQVTAETVFSAATVAIAGVNDPHTGGVSITGTATEDQVLTANTSTLADIDGVGALNYQWQHNVGSGFVNIAGATASTYTLGDGDVGGVVRVVVSYTDLQNFAETSTSPATVAITNINDVPTGTVVITGVATENEVLTADTSTLADADGLGPLQYQWQRDSGSGFVNIAGPLGAGATYTLDDPDVGASIRVVVSYTDGGVTAEAKTSAVIGPVANGNDPHTGGVSVTGTATEDQVLTAVSTLGDLDGLGVLHYVWQRNTGSGFVNTGAADQATYTLTDADVGGTVRVVVSYTDGGGFPETATSAATAAVANINDAPTGAVTIAGTLAEDQVLTADVSTLADADGRGTLHYIWQRNTGSGFVTVGADQATYTLGDTDVGATFRVVVNYTDLHGTAESKTSAVSAAIANVNDAPIGVNDATSVIQRLSTSGSVRTNDTDIDNTNVSLTVTSVAFNFTHVNQAVVAGGTVVNGGFGRLTINPDGTYTYVANQEGLVIGQVVTDKFDYTVRDPGGATSTAQLTVTVTGSATGDANANIIISDGLGHTLTGRGGADTLIGNGGADIFAYEAIGDSTVAAFDTITDFAHGVDSLRLTPLMTASTKLTLATDGTNEFLYIDQNGDGVAEGLILAQGQGLQVSDIVTGVANQGFTIHGSGGADVLTGGNGDDVIAGYGGADTIRGAGGADFLYGGAGADTFAYGAGDSSLLHWDVIADFATGQDKINISAADGGNVVIARFGATSFVYFGNLSVGFSAIQVYGDVQADDLVFSGAVTGVTIFGGAGNETLRGGAGRDVLVGGLGHSTLVGGAAADILYGGVGTDTFLYQSIADSNFTAFDLIVGFDYGTDKIDISAIDGGKITLARYEGNTFVYSAPDSGGNFQSAVAVQGTTLKSTDLIVAGGSSQAFTLVGDGASHNVADVLVGAGGNDILYGLDGADTLTGGGGADFLVGGTGADTFVFLATSDSSSIASDLVYGFSSAEGDRINLTGIDARTGGGDDAFTVVTAFSSVSGQLIIGAADSSGYHHLSGDVNGDGVADFVIALQVIGTLSASDILL